MSNNLEQTLAEIERNLIEIKTSQALASEGLKFYYTSINGQRTSGGGDLTKTKLRFTPDIENVDYIVVLYEEGSPVYGAGGEDTLIAQNQWLVRKAFDGETLRYIAVSTIPGKLEII